MTTNLHRVLTSVRVGSPENAYHTFIENLRAILDVPIMNSIRLGIANVLAKHAKESQTTEPLRS